MKLKKLIASHFANYAEAWAANSLIDQGRIQPLLTATYTLDQVNEGYADMMDNKNVRGVIQLAYDRGVPLYNAGRADSCVAIYEVAAVSLLSFSEDLSDRDRERLTEALRQIAGWLDGDDYQVRVFEIAGVAPSSL